MCRWNYPFNSKKDVKKFLNEAEKETGMTYFVRQVSMKAYVFKIFVSEKDYEEYQMKKKKKNEH